MENFQFGAGMGAAYAINANQQAAARDLQFNQIVAAFIAQGMSGEQAQVAAQQHFARIAANTPRTAGSVLWQWWCYFSMAMFAVLGLGIAWVIFSK